MSTSFYNGYRIYMDIITGENCQYRLLFPPSFIGQFVYPLGGKGMGKRRWREGIVILALYKFHFTRKHDDLV